MIKSAALVICKVIAISFGLNFDNGVVGCSPV
jgi:hypothetical protein